MLNILRKLGDFRSLEKKNEHIEHLDNLINLIKIINILNIFEKTHTPFTMLPKGKIESYRLPLFNGTALCSQII